MARHRAALPIQVLASTLIALVLLALPVAARLPGLAVPAEAAGPTYVCPTGGTISANQTWDPSNGVYVVTCNVTIAAGVTVTVNPGTIVKLSSTVLSQVMEEIDADE